MSHQLPAANRTHPFDLTKVARTCLTVVLFLVSAFIRPASAESDLQINTMRAAGQILNRVPSVRPLRPGRYDCPQSCSGGGFGCAVVPKCVGAVTIANLQIVETKHVDMRYPDPAKIPVSRQLQKITVDNCLSDPWVWNEKLVMQSTQRVEAKNTTLLSDVENRSINLSLDAKIAAKLGVVWSSVVSETKR